MKIFEKISSPCFEYDLSNEYILKYDRIIFIQSFLYHYKTKQEKIENRIESR